MTIKNNILSLEIFCQYNQQGNSETESNYCHCRGFLQSEAKLADCGHMFVCIILIGLLISYG